MTSPSSPRYLDIGALRIAYHHHAGDGDTGVMFLGGFKSDMEGGKALMLDAFCRENHIPFTRMDYGGHGQSGGAFEEGTIGQWRDHVLAVFDTVASKRMIVVGSSMGGWMMLLLALARPEQVAGLVGIASAPDFTEGLMWAQFSAAQKAEMEEKGQVILPNCVPGESDYPITRTLIEEGRNHLLMHAPIAIHCPVHLLHGMCDPDVPWQLSVELAQQLAREDVRISLVKDGDHRMSTPRDLALIREAVQDMLETLRPS